MSSRSDQSRTDWAQVEAMTDADIARAVADDPDAAPPLTGEQLARMPVVWPTDIAATRRRFGLSQTEFATWFSISPDPLRNWEQGRRVPDGPARALLSIIERDPEAVRRAIGQRRDKYRMRLCSQKGGLTRFLFKFSFKAMVASLRDDP